MQAPKFPRSLLIGFSALGMLGCLATGDGSDRSNSEALDSKSNPLNFGSITLTPTPDLLKGIEQALETIEARKKMPYTLRVTTCDKSNAESGDNVYVSVSENGVSREMLAGKLGLERGKSKDFELTGHVPVDAKEIDGLKIRKSGTNAWCISRVELWRNGELAWRFDDGDPNWSDLIREDGPQEALYRGLQPSSG